MTLIAAAIGLAGAGGGKWSLDRALGWFSPPGWIGLAIALAGGFGGAAGLLAAGDRACRVSGGRGRRRGPFDRTILISF